MEELKSCWAWLLLYLNLYTGLCWQFFAFFHKLCLNIFKIISEIPLQFVQQTEIFLLHHSDSLRFYWFVVMLLSLILYKNRTLPKRYKEHSLVREEMLVNCKFCSRLHINIKSVVILLSLLNWTFPRYMKSCTITT